MPASTSPQNAEQRLGMDRTSAPHKSLRRGPPEHLGESLPPDGNSNSRFPDSPFRASDSQRRTPSSGGNGHQRGDQPPGPGGGSGGDSGGQPPARGYLPPPVHYSLAIYEPGSIETVLARFDSRVPFGGIHVGDFVNVWGLVDVPQSQALLRVVGVEHYIWQRSGRIRQLTSVFTERARHRPGVLLGEDASSKA